MIQFLPTVKKEVLTVRVLRAKLGILSPTPHPLDQRFMGNSDID